MAEETAGLTCFERVGDPRRSFTAVGRDDCVRLKRLHDFARHPRGMDRAFSLDCLVPFTALSRAHRCELLDPRLVAGEFHLAGGGDRLAEKFATIGDYAEFDAAAASDLLRFDIHLNHTSVGGNQAVASAGRESDARAEQENEIGALVAAAGVRCRMNRAERAKAQGMVLGNCTARLRVGQYRSVS